MPIFRKFTTKDGHYLRTSIGGRIITFQLTADGARKIAQARYKPGDSISRSFFVELCREGNAYTEESGRDAALLATAAQGTFDFSNKSSSFVAEIAETRASNLAVGPETEQKTALRRTQSWPKVCLIIVGCLVSFVLFIWIILKMF